MVSLGKSVSVNNPSTFDITLFFVSGTKIVAYGKLSPEFLSTTLPVNVKFFLVGAPTYVLTISVLGVYFIFFKFYILYIKLKSKGS